MRKNDAFVAKIVNTRLTKGFMAIFAPAESLPSPATQCLWYFHNKKNVLTPIIKETPNSKISYHEKLILFSFIGTPGEISDARE